MTLDAARRFDAGDEARVEIASIKFHGATMLHTVIDRAIQVHGALGVSGEHRWSACSAKPATRASTARTRCTGPRSGADC